MKKSLFVMMTTLMVFMLGMVANAEENPVFGELNESAPLLEQIYNSVAAGDYTVMQQIDGSNAANALATQITTMGLNDYYCIFDGTTDTGKGAGIYSFDDGGYYFYYGDYVNGFRQGQGSMMFNYSDEAADPTNIHYYSYTGAWANDKPNGAGTVRMSCFVDDPDYRYIALTTGTYVDGLENGDIERTYNDGYGDYDFVWHSTMGVPTRTFMTLSGTGKQINTFTQDGVPTVGTVSTVTLPANGEYAGWYADAASYFGLDENTIFALQFTDYDTSEDGTQYFPYFYNCWNTTGTQLGIAGFAK